METLGFRKLKLFRVCDKLFKFLQHAGQPGQLNPVDLLHLALPAFMKGLSFRVLKFFRMCQTVKVTATGWAARPVGHVDVLH